MSSDKKDYFVNLRCLCCLKEVNAGEMKMRFTFCGCGNKTCIAIFDVVLEQYLFGAVDEAKVEVQVQSAKTTIKLSLKEWKAQQLEFKKRNEVFEEEFVKEL